MKKNFFKTLSPLLYLLASCQKQQISLSPELSKNTPELSKNSSGLSKNTPSPKESEQTLAAVKSIRTLEEDFTENSCSNSSIKLIQNLELAGSKLPTHTEFMKFVCLTRIAQPRSKLLLEISSAALDFLNQNEKQLIKLFPIDEVLSWKSFWHIQLADTDKALQTKKTLLKYLTKLSEQKSVVELEIDQLESSNLGLNSEQKNLWNKAQALATSQENLHAAITIARQLLSQIDQQASKNRISINLKSWEARLETRFAQDALAYQESKSEGDSSAAADKLTLLKERYPESRYQERIKNLSSGGFPVQNLGSGFQGQNSVITLAPSGIQNNGTNVKNAETVAAEAKSSLDNGDPERALKIIDSFPSSTQNQKLFRLRKDALNNHARDSRIRVRDLYTKAISENNSEQKKQTLLQCKNILETLISTYPDAPGKAGIERSLRSIKNDIASLK
jgi:hypothetical protein